MTSFGFTKKDIFGQSSDEEENHDLMQVVMIRRGDPDNTESIFDYLNGVFTSDVARMDPYSGIAGDEDQNALVKAIQMLKEGRTDAEILSAGIDQHTLDLAKVCWSR